MSYCNYCCCEVYCSRSFPDGDNFVYSCCLTDGGRGDGMFVVAVDDGADAGVCSGGYGEWLGVGCSSCLG